MRIQISLRKKKASQEVKEGRREGERKGNSAYSKYMDLFTVFN